MPLPTLSRLLAAARLQIGTTKRGIGPAYSSKATRNGVRVGDLRRPEQFAGKRGWLAAAVSTGSAQAAGHCLAMCDVMRVQCVHATLTVSECIAAEGAQHASSLLLVAPADKLRKLSQDGFKRFDDFEYDVEADIKQYQVR